MAYQGGKRLNEEEKKKRQRQQQKVRLHVMERDLILLTFGLMVLFVILLILVKTATTNNGQAIFGTLMILDFAAIAFFIRVIWLLLAPEKKVVTEPTRPKQKRKKGARVEGISRSVAGQRL